MDQMRNHLGVGIGGELIARRLKLRANRRVVLDDAVVHHRDAAADMRMGIALGGHAVRRPARVADADHALELLLVGQLLELRHAPARAQAFEAAIDDGDACGVVAAVLEAAQTFQQDRDDVAPRYRGDDSAHREDPCSRNSAPAVSAAAGAAMAKSAIAAPNSITAPLTTSGWRPSVAIQSTSVSAAY